MKRKTIPNNGDTPNTHSPSAQGVGGRLRWSKHKMKYKANVLAVILAGIAVTAFVTVSLRNANSARMLGDVILPMQVMINDVLGASRGGNHDLVERKLEVIGQILEDFKNKGTTPEMSVSKVTELK